MPGVPSSCGCNACRQSKKKCDQLTPSCSRCTRLGIHCVGSGERRYKFISALQLSRKVPSSRIDQGASGLVSALQVTDVRFELGIYGPFMAELPRRLGRNEALDASVRALTKAYPSVHSHQLTPDMYKSYGEALRHLCTALGNPATATSIETLCAVYLVVICQGWIRRGADFIPSHGEAIAHLLNAAAERQDWQGQFEAEVSNTLLVLVLLESFSNHKIKLDTRLWASSTSPAIAKPFRPPMKGISEIECLRASSLAAISGYTRNIQGSLPEIVTFHEVWQVDLANMKALLSGMSNMAASELTLAQRRIHVRRQTGYGTLLLLGMMANWALRAFVIGDMHTLELEIAMIVDEVVELAEQAIQYRPLGSSAMPGFINAAKAMTTNMTKLDRLEELLQSYQSDFPLCH
ncbi:hypothetical protein QBC38DRAFT_485370 [Podospora fimiseda]|uniref:Zn(2)-C6 fungal-type domain-containing protein n=1 Tax=Podospora fimiseda TaxID=252190 RepID=A0AAN7GQB0_9PEZI|nr:hypothetical protein QBC38DRAFT_485370 [Podospora fimiseda]